MKNVLPYIKWSAKAVISCAVAYAGAVATGYTDGTMTTGEWWAAAASGLTAAALVFGIGNGDKPGMEPAEDAGDTELDEVEGDVPMGGFE